MKRFLSLWRLALVLVVLLPPSALLAVQWTYRLNWLNVGGGIDKTYRYSHPMVADATGELLSTAFGANVFGDWGIALGATLTRVTFTTEPNFTGADLLVGPCVTYGVGSTRNRAIPVFSLTARIGAIGALGEIQAEWGRGIVKAGIRGGAAAYFNTDEDYSFLAPFLGVYVGLGGWGAFTKR